MAMWERDACLDDQSISFYEYLFATLIVSGCRNLALIVPVPSCFLTFCDMLIRKLRVYVGSH